MQRTPPFGLYNMLGNVWEWVEDAYKPHETMHQTNPVVSGNGFRVLRGGSWILNPDVCRAAWRYGNRPDARSDFIGFRVCRGSPIETRDAATLGAEPPSR